MLEAILSHGGIPLVVKNMQPELYHNIKVSAITMVSTYKIE